jgi:hypothetical protein
VLSSRSCTTSSRLIKIWLTMHLWWHHLIKIRRESSSSTTSHWNLWSNLPSNFRPAHRNKLK